MPDWATILISSVVSVLIATVGAIVVVWQVAAQAKKAIEQNRHNEALKLKLRVYEEILRVCAAATDAELAVANIVRTFSVDVETAHRYSPPSGVHRLPSARVPALLEANRVCSDAMVEVVSLTERWQIIEPRIDLFRHAMNSAMHDHRAAFHDYFAFAVDAMPLELPTPPGEPPLVRPWTPPDPSTSKTLSDRLIDALSECGSYVSDLQIEMQNLLVGELFGNRIAPREPLDPKYVAVRLDRYDELKKYFETQTAWGRVTQQVLADVRSRVEG